jgi:hypothetical protein
MLVKKCNSVEFLQQVEDDLGLVLDNRLTDFSQIIADPQRMHMVANFAQGANDIELGYPSGDRDMVQSGLSSPAIARGT